MNIGGTSGLEKSLQCSQCGVKTLHSSNLAHAGCFVVLMSWIIGIPFGEIMIAPYVGWGVFGLGPLVGMFILSQGSHYRCNKCGGLRKS